MAAEEEGEKGGQSLNGYYCLGQGEWWAREGGREGGFLETG